MSRRKLETHPLTSLVVSVGNHPALAISQFEGNRLIVESCLASTRIKTGDAYFHQSDVYSDTVAECFGTRVGPYNDLRGPADDQDRSLVLDYGGSLDTPPDTVSAYVTRPAG
ncbi:hypothetical protein RB195_020196 [Necator americanus]|uniref:Uncharacterized protein n=1 Tax=Necator americanus TaxID=51031 RepID=A0ABR1CJ92_NECAM